MGFSGVMMDLEQEIAQTSEPLGVRVYRVLVTPELAERLLELNVSNRPLVESRVNEYTRQIRNHEWTFNGEPLIFSDRGLLLSAQHRLHAVVRAKTPVEFLVVWGVKHDVFDTLDTGRPRSGSDVLAIDGVPDATETQRALRVVHGIKNGSPDGKSHASLHELRAMAKDHPDIARSIKRYPDTKRLMFSGMWHGLHYLMAQVDQSAADKFFDDLLSGEMLEQSDPVWMLRERLLKNSMSRRKLGRADINGSVIKAWNARRAGSAAGSRKGTNLIVWRPGANEPFPKIDGLEG